MKENEQDLLEMLRNHELSLKKLYEVFLMRFPAYKELWEGLIKDEDRHAEWIEKLRSYPATSKWMADNVHVKLQAVKSSIGYLETMMKKAEEGGLKQIQALSAARDFESALIEKQFSKLNKSSSEKINTIMAALSAESEKHLKKIMETIGSEKGLNP